MLSIDTGQMKCPKWLSWLCCCSCCYKCCHDDDDKEPLLSSETSSEYGGSADVTFDDEVTPKLFTIVQQPMASANKQDSYQVEQSLLGSTEVQEWKVDLAAEEESLSATPSFLSEGNALGPSTDHVTVLPSVPPTGVVTSHSLVTDSNHMTKVSYEFHLRRRT